MLFICEVVAWMLLIYCNFKFSVSSNFIVISACSSLSPSFRKSISGSRIEDGYDGLFFIAFFRHCGARITIKISVILCFQNHVYSGNMLFLLMFHFLQQVV